MSLFEDSTILSHFKTGRLVAHSYTNVNTDQAFFLEKGSKLVLCHTQIWVLDCILLEQSTQLCVFKRKRREFEREGRVINEQGLTLPVLPNKIFSMRTKPSQRRAFPRR